MPYFPQPPPFMIHGAWMRIICDKCNGRGRIGGDTLYNSEICSKCHSVGTLVIPDPDENKLIRYVPGNIPLRDIPEFALSSYYYPIENRKSRAKDRRTD